MAFDWKEFLALADYLLEGRDDRVSRECLQRAAVSRAYYAFFVPFVTDLLGEQILREQEQLQTMLRLSSTCVIMVTPQLPSGLAGFANGAISVTMITT